MSEPLHVAVVGAGVAGTAAAWSARRRGAHVVVFDGKPGATALSNGACDGELAGTDFAPVPLVEEFLTELDYWRPPRAIVVTSAGVTRETTALAPQLLRFEKLRGGRLLVVDVERDDWDGPLLARTLAEDPRVVAAGVEVCSEPIGALCEGHERRIASHDFAALHDHPERRAWLVAHLQELSGGYAGILLGPWLGLERNVVELVRQELDCEVGEVAGEPGSAHATRFLAARDRLFAGNGIACWSARVSALRGMTGQSPALDFALQSPELDGESTEPVAGGAERRLPFDAIVLALGGVSGGGILFCGRPGGADLSAADERAPLGGSWRASLDLPDEMICASTSRRAGEATWFGEAVSRRSELEGAGLVSQDGVLPVGACFVAGDAMQGRPRTILTALVSGLAAGARAASR